MQHKVEDKQGDFLLKVDKCLILKEINFKRCSLIDCFLNYEKYFCDLARKFLKRFQTKNKKWLICNEKETVMKVSKDEVLIELSNLIGKDIAILLLLSQALEDGYGELIAIAHQDIEIEEQWVKENHHEGGLTRYVEAEQ